MKKHYFRVPCTLFVVAGLMLCSGCGPKLPKTATVGGRVTYNGKPVVSGTIVFQPAQGRPAMGEIQPDGTFKLTTFESGDGALLGKHRVTIEARNVRKPPPMEGAGASNIAPKVEWLVPRKYANSDSSNLIAEVKPGQNNIDFDLPSEPGGKR